MPMLRKTAFGLGALTALVLFAVLAQSAPADARATRNERLGNSWEFELQGNPSTGYHWELNPTASSGLDLVKVESLGYASGSGKPGMVGAPAPFVFRLTCVKAGTAQLIFDYIGPTGKRSQDSHEAWVRCE
jgi:predicted secreted protein